MSQRRSRFARVPRMEVLEDRALPAAGVFINGAVVSVVGTKKNDTVQFTFDGDQGSVNFNGLVFALNDVVNTINVQTGKGKDWVGIRSTSPIPGDANLTANVNLGDGKDTFLAQTSKNVNAGAQLTFNVNGDDDDDNLTANFKGAHVYDGAVVNLNFFGDDDDDRLTFNYKGRVIGDINVNFDGGDDEDWINVTARFRPPEVDEGDGGNDEFQGDTLRVNINGGDDDDTIGVYITSQPGANYAVVANVNGGDGKDLCNRTPNVDVFSIEKGGVFDL